MEQKIQPIDICVLAPYMKQVRIIRILLRKEHLSEVNGSKGVLFNLVG